MTTAIRDFAEDDWRPHLRRKGKSPETVSTYTHAVNRFAAYLDSTGHSGAVEDVTKRDLLRFIDALNGEGRKAATVVTYVRGVKSLLRYALDFGIIDADPAGGIGRELPNDAPTDVTILTDEQIAALRRATTGRDFFARRNRALIEVALATGMRRGELASIKVTPSPLFDGGGGAVTCTVSKTRPRTVALSAEAVDALRVYLRLRAERKTHTEALFVGAKGEALDGKAIWDIVRRIGVKAGLPWLHPHTLRHTHTAHLKRAGVDSEVIRETMGWKPGSKMLAHYAASVNGEVALRRQFEQQFPGANIDAMMAQWQRQRAA
jgi:integrase/recombinase XerC